MPINNVSCKKLLPKKLHFICNNLFPESIPKPIPEPTTNMFWIWVNPGKELPIDHPILKLSNVAPLTRHMVSVLESSSFGVPPGYGPQELSATGAAKRTADWIEYYKKNIREDIPVSIFLTHFGHNSPNAHSLMRNELDKVNTEKGDNTVFCNNGIAQNNKWSREYFDVLANEIDSRNLNPPTRMHFDFEGISIPHFSVRGRDENGKAKGWLTASLKDPTHRQHISLIDGKRTLADFWKEAINDGISYTDDTWTWSEVNHEIYSFMLSVCYSACEYALHESFWSLGKQIWPDILTSNYNLSIGTKKYPVQGLGKLYGKFEYIPKLNYTDFSSPVLYPVSDSAISGHKSTDQDWFKEYKVNNREDLFIEVSKRKILNIKLNNPNGKICPWIPYVGFKQGEVIVNKQHLEKIMIYGKENGINEWALWHGNDITEEGWQAYIDIINILS